VVLRRSGVKLKSVLKFAVAALSVVVAGLTWRYGTINSAPAPSEAVRSEASSDSQALAPTKETAAPQREQAALSPRPARPAPADLSGSSSPHDGAAPSVLERASSATGSTPVVSVLTESKVNPAKDVMFGTSSEARAAASVGPQPKRQLRTRLRKSTARAGRVRDVVRHSSDAAEGEPESGDFDFGIEEPAAPAPKQSRVRAIRGDLR
jgi:hypothetical protein